MIKKIQLNGNEINLDLICQKSDGVVFKIDDTEYEYKIHSKSANELILQNNQNKLYKLAVSNEAIYYSGKKYSFSKISSISDSSYKTTLSNSLVAPLPGKVISVKCKLKGSVKEGNTLVVIEAMKMEHNIVAYKDGILAKLNVKVGDSVPEGFIIGEIE